MKNKLIALLKTSFASKGFNTKELESLADLVIGQHTLTDESTDEDLTAVVTAAKPTADFVQSVASRQVTEAKKPKPVDKKPEPTPEPETEPAEDMPAWAKALVTSTQALAQGLEAIKGEKVANTRKQAFIESLKGTTKEYQERELKKFDRMKFDTDEQFTEFMEESKEFHTDAVQEVTNSGLGGERPAGGAGKPVNGEKEVSPAMKELIADRTAKAEAKAAHKV